jgi:SAM-dependent methyltransferase
MRALVALTPWELRRDLRRLEAAVGDHLLAVETRLDVLEQSVGQRLDRIEEIQRVLQSELQEIGGERLRRVDDRLDGLETGLAGVGDDVARLRDRVLPAVVGRSDAIFDRLAEEVDEVGGLLERVLRHEPLPAPAVTLQDDVGVAELARVQPLLVDAFRGSEEEVRGRLDHWLPDLAAFPPVLDLGCGRGELLLLLRDAGVAASGVEGDPALAQAARRRGLEIEEGDVLDMLRRRSPGSCGAVTAFHLFEHLPAGKLLEVLAEVRRVLRPGGRLLVESPNPHTLRVGASLYWIDPTHQRPLLSETLELFVRTSGLVVERIETLHPFPDDQRVGAGCDRAPVEAPGAVGVLARRMTTIEGRLDEWLSGPRDFAMVAIRPEDGEPTGATTDGRPASG